MMKSNNFILNLPFITVIFQMVWKHDTRAMNQIVDNALASKCCKGARCSSMVRMFACGAMGRRIDPSWGGPIELFLVPASAP